MSLLMKRDNTHTLREFMENRLLRGERILTNASESPPSLILEEQVLTRFIKDCFRIWDGVNDKSIP